MFKAFAGRNLSLYVILNVSIFFIIILTMVFQTTSLYYNYKNQLEKEIHNNMEVSVEQLENSLIPFIESYQVNEYIELIRHEMKHKHLYAIVIEDYVTGKIKGADSFISGKIKDVSWEVIDYDITQHQALLKEAYGFQTSEIKNSDNEVIGKITIYSTNHFLEDALDSFVYNNNSTLIISFIVLFVLLAVILRMFLVKPLNQTIKRLQSKQKDGLPTQDIKVNTSKEFSFLSETINSMIHEIRDSNQQLEENKLKWQFAVEGNGDGLWEWNIETQKVYFSTQWKKQLGYNESELENSFETWESRVHPEDITDVKQAIKDYLSGKNKRYEKEHRLKCKDGEYKWILTRGIIVQWDSENNPLIMLGTHRDISAQKEYEAEMRQALTVYQHTHDGIMITDEKNNIISVNPAFEKTTGYSANEVLGKNPNILKSEFHSNDFYENLWQSLDEKGYWSGEITNKNKQGESYEEMLTINVIKNENKATNYIGVFTDISLLKRQEKMLLQQSRTSAVGEMIGNIAHQWRQPLSVVSTAATGLKLLLEFDKNVPKDEIIEVLDKINTQSQYLSKTIDDFRDFFRSDIEDKIEFNVSDTLKQIDNLTIDVRKNNFIQYHTKYEDVYVHGSQNLLIQALINIINNAMDILKQKDSNHRNLFVTLTSEDDKMCLEIKDDGGGIDADVIDKVFDPYFTTKHESIGTGLGLYICRQIITEHLNGNIYVRNAQFEFEGEQHQGACFLIHIPSIKKV